MKGQIPRSGRALHRYQNVDARKIILSPCRGYLGPLKILSYYVLAVAKPLLLRDLARNFCIFRNSFANLLLSFRL